MRKTLLVFCGLILILAFQNCAPTAVSSRSQNQTQTAPCTPVSQTLTQDLRILFLVDNSGSTKATDPHQYYRSQVLKIFLQQYGNKQNLTYLYGFFSGTKAYFFDSAIGGFHSVGNLPFGPAVDLTTALNTFNLIPPSGNTPYKAALQLATQSIQNDLQQGSKVKNYILIFMSDGEPTDVSNQPSLPGNLQDLVQKAMALIQAAGGTLTLSTVYFNGANVAADASNLQLMAQIGGGQFVNTNLNPNLTINDLITVPGQCPQ